MMLSRILTTCRPRATGSSPISSRRNTSTSSSPSTTTGFLERALDEANFRDYKTIIRGETSTDAISAILAGAPRVKILKMHGSSQSNT